MKLVRILAAGAVSSVLAVSVWGQVEDLLRQAPPEAAAVANPLAGQEQAQQAGAKLFARECAGCHGANGAGGLGKPPPLRRPDVQAAPPGALFWVLRNGSRQRGMPSFAHLPEPQRWQIITWLQALPKDSN